MFKNGIPVSKSNATFESAVLPDSKTAVINNAPGLDLFISEGTN